MLLVYICYSFFKKKLKKDHIGKDLLRVNKKCKTYKLIGVNISMKMMKMKRQIKDSRVWMTK